MESIKNKQLPSWFYLLATVLLIGAVYHGIKVYRQAFYFQMIANPEKIIVDENTPDILVFTKAIYFAKSGHSNEAARLYASLRNTQDMDLRIRALHNLATLYLRDGAKYWNANGVLEAAHVSTQVDLAKQNYREALRLNPEDWDARYNLEYAWRITPPPKEKAKADFQGSKSSVFSTLPGLPGGGP